jgi:hypothetical protein
MFAPVPGKAKDGGKLSFIPWFVDGNVLDELTTEAIESGAGKHDSGDICVVSGLLRVSSASGLW